jgi:hypothetical protein
MGQQKMTGEADYIAPTKPGEMHGHARLGGITGRVLGAPTREEGEVQGTRNRALDSLVKAGMPANWSPRDTNLPVEKKRAATRPATRKVSSSRR